MQSIAIMLSRREYIFYYTYNALLYFYVYYLKNVMKIMSLALTSSLLLPDLDPYVTSWLNEVYIVALWWGIYSWRCPKSSEKADKAGSGGIDSDQTECLLREIYTTSADGVNTALPSRRKYNVVTVSKNKTDVDTEDFSQKCFTRDVWSRTLCF